ncbi:hypothetical protein [Halarcobacter anaerophilus]|jgi:uncharacterized protein YxjI|uniref:hypothetical protein n=1 Tax=Halarcobacter anaerophilus TaxID=877500 RepID=UPI000B22A4BF|nr:hypothetical protein [Halarcobacter anaerophilus]QDF28274.1 hypothetical protein AANAER_0781 [Halarcobacter anaerophilus]
MSDYRIRAEINRLVEQNNIEDPKKSICPIIKIIKMRHKQLDTNRILKVAKEVFIEE